MFLTSNFTSDQYLQYPFLFLCLITQLISRVFQKSPDRPVSQNDDHSKRLGQSHLPHSGRIGSQLGQVPNQRAPFVPHGTAGGQHQRPFFPPSYGQPNQNRNFPSRGQFPRRGHRPQISSNPSLRALHGQQRDYFLNRGNFPGSDKVVNADRKYGKPKSVRRIISGRFNSREKLKLGMTDFFVKVQGRLITEKKSNLGGASIIFHSNFTMNFTNNPVSAIQAVARY